MKIIIGLLLFSLFSCVGNKNLKEKKHLDCIDVNTFLEMRIKFKNDTLKRRDTTEIFLTFINKTDSVLKFYLKDLIKLDVIDTSNLILFKDDLFIGDNDVQNIKLITLNPYSSHIKTFLMIVPNSYFITGLNEVQAQYFYGRVDDQTKQTKNICGLLISNKVNLFIIER